MATIDKPAERRTTEEELFDEEGFPWLENGERMDQKTFHERYLKTPDGFKAELIGGVVYVMSSPLGYRHGRGDSRLSGWLYLYCSATPGTEVQNNTTTILGEASEPQPDTALLILPSHGGRTREGGKGSEYTYGPPELVAEVALSSRSIDLSNKLRDYEAAGVLEYVVLDLRDQLVHWFTRRDGRFETISPDPDGMLRSRIFPGLWLDPNAIQQNDKAAVNAALQHGLATPEHAAFVSELERRRGQPSA
jgi:Uma2 family endonuclease